ncbi:RMD1 family protein [Candidatus Berkiella aquae]|uniref:RMD1 family protein n=1 Tax=Candidatus Berkiella aquae TaxID=295108 RepID=A0A0Q9YN18_9GAMM|nr:RMD1 family protein [Candidatus Berkiella aquae]MCS5712626.1 RMD1 family protein [Candidatus Berkiella aquae]
MQLEDIHPLDILSSIPEELSANLAQLGSCEVNAVLIGNEINLKALTNKGASSRKESSVLIRLAEQSAALIYSFGAIVFFNATTSATVELISRCQRFASHLISTPETEQFSVIIQPDQPEGIVRNKVSIKRISKAHLEIIADALAKSVVIEYHENRIGSIFDKIEPIAKSLKERGKLGYRSNDLLKHIGASLVMAQEMVGKIEVTEKPLILWEHGELEPLHAQLVEDLEIIERQSTLERKLELISRTAQTSLEVLQQHQSHRLEWYIIILIGIEILLHLYQMFLSPVV